MGAGAPQDEEYEESTDFSWTKNAFEMLESDVFHDEVVSREQAVALVSGVVPGVDTVWMVGRRTLPTPWTALGGLAMKSPHSATERAFDTSMWMSRPGLLLKPSRTPTPPRQRLEASCPLVRFRCVDPGRVKPARTYDDLQCGQPSWCLSPPFVPPWVCTPRNTPVFRWSSPMPG